MSATNAPLPTGNSSFMHSANETVTRKWPEPLRGTQATGLYYAQINPATYPRLPAKVRRYRCHIAVNIHVPRRTVDRHPAKKNALRYIHLASAHDVMGALSVETNARSLSTGTESADSASFCTRNTEAIGDCGNSRPRSPRPQLLLPPGVLRV